MFGARLDLEKVKGFLKKPVAPAIGAACQYVLMPLVSLLVESQDVGKSAKLMHRIG